MSEIEQEIREEAHEAAADVAAPVAAEVAEHAASEAARDAVEEVVEHVEDLVERAEEAIDQQEDNAQWERLTTELAQAENRIVTRVVAELSPMLSRSMLNPTEIPPTATPTEEELADLSEAAEELSEAAEEASPDGEAVFDPVAVESAEPEARNARRRPRGLGRRR